MDFQKKDLEVKLEKVVVFELKVLVMLEDLVEEYKNTVRESTILDSIRNLMKNAKWTAQQAMEALSIPKEDRKNYLERL